MVDNSSGKDAVSSSASSALLDCPFCGEACVPYLGYGQNKVGCGNEACALFSYAFDRFDWNTRSSK